MKISIDTNILLDFFHLTNESLNELKNILVLNKLGHVSILLSEQIRDEFTRNREVKIADALKKFKEEKLNNQIPQMVKEFSEFDDLQRALKDYQLNKDRLIQQLEENVKNCTLKADETVQQLFDKAEWVAVDDAILRKGKIRFDRGNPPGKNNSYGDAIVWETLLQCVADEEDLHLITDDKDYFSPLNPDTANQFLKVEWEGKKKSRLLIYRRLSEFLAVNFKGAMKAIETEQDYLIDQLLDSSSFATTHAILSKLNKYEHFNKIQVSKLVSAFFDNSQVYWIIQDDDVQELLVNLVNNHHKDIDTDKIVELKGLIAK